MFVRTSKLKIELLKHYIQDSQKHLTNMKKENSIPNISTHNLKDRDTFNILMLKF